MPYVAYEDMPPDLSGLLKESQARVNRLTAALQKIATGTTDLVAAKIANEALGEK